MHRNLMATPLFRIGARGSPLSLAQTGRVRTAFAVQLGVEEGALEIIPIVTSGDTIQDRRLIEAGGKGLFTKELDEALLDGRIDMAVHSLKDLPTRLPDGITLACVPEREDPRDAFVSLKAKAFGDLAVGATIGTASLRRQAQALFARPDLRVAMLRGNVDTRLRRLETGDADATFLALAGLKRLGLEHHAASVIDPQDMPPACCQGALAMTSRTNDDRVRDELQRLDNHVARIEIEAERAFLEALDGSCRTAIGALARYTVGRLEFIGEALAADGSLRWRRARSIAATAAFGNDIIGDVRYLGRTLGAEIRGEAGDALTTDKS